MTEFAGLIRALAQSGVDFIVVGGVAAAAQDAAGVVAVQEGLDVEYLRRWAKHLAVGALLDDILAGRIRPKRT